LASLAITPADLLTVEKLTDEDNSQTIRPSWTSHNHASISRESLLGDRPDVDDYSDVTGEDGDVHIIAKVANFKVFLLDEDHCCITSTHITELEARNSAKRTLYHPDDIKSVGIAQLLPCSVLATSREGMSPVATPAPSRLRPARSGLFPMAPHPDAHSRSLSLGSGSLGRLQAQRLHAQAELGRYMEDDDEDYEDMFAGPTEHGPCRSTSFTSKVELTLHTAHASSSTLKLNTRLSSTSWVGDVFLSFALLTTL
jgi:hypothetical protein